MWTTYKDLDTNEDLASLVISTVHEPSQNISKGIRLANDTEKASPTLTTDSFSIEKNLTAELVVEPGVS